MNNLVMLAYHHCYGGGWSDWIAHVAILSVIHSLVCGVVFKLMHELTRRQAAVLAVAVVGCIIVRTVRGIGRMVITPVYSKRH